jgi:hypothetical protein
MTYFARSVGRPVAIAGGLDAGGVVMRRHPVLRGALVGAGLGVLWGVGARVFMRLVSDNPSFSWVGTLFILGLSMLMGVGLGVVAGAKASGARRWWLLALLPGLLLLAGQGMPFIPAFFLGGLLFSRRHVVLRALGALSIIAGVVVLWSLLRLNQDTMISMPTPMLVRGLVGFVVLSVALAAGGSILYRPWAPRPAGAAAGASGAAAGAAGAAGAEPQEQVPVPASSGLPAAAVPTRAHS